MCVIITDALIIGRLSAVLRIIGIGRLVRWYRPIVFYTTTVNCKELSHRTVI